MFVLKVVKMPLPHRGESIVISDIMLHHLFLSHLNFRAHNFRVVQL